MVNLITKSYPSLVDIYSVTGELNPETGEFEEVINWDEPKTAQCNVTDVEPESNLERFGQVYTNSVFIKIELPDNVLDLSHVVGNLRSKDERRFYYGTSTQFMTFNVSGLSAQVDLMGNIVCYVAYCRFLTTLTF